MDRRKFVKAVVGLTSVPFFGVYGCASDCVNRKTSKLIHRGNDRLELAPGLSYTEIDRNGNILGDGFFSPGRPDGMGCFPGLDNRLILCQKP